MKCLMKYEWVKLMRSHLPQGKGVMGAWMKLASRAAFRKGIATYCGYKNEVSPGMWSGGIVGIKSILGIKKKSDALLMLDKLSELGYIKYELNSENKKLTYQITDWVVKCSGEECMNGTVYTTDGYGFLCLPRNITERLVSLNYKFEETDAWLDLWCHMVSNDAGNAFSFLAPVVQYGKYGALLTLENLGKRWNWEKRKYGDSFKNTEMSSHYTKCPAPTAALCLINCIQPIRKLQYPHTRKLCVFLKKYAFTVRIRTNRLRITSISTS